MSAVSKLPDLVVQKIIGIAAEPSCDYLFFWKSLLPLLAVCSAWRNAAMPIVYSKVFIESTEMDDVVQNSAHRSHLLDGVLNSNIDLVASVGSTQLVKRVDIDIKTFGCLRALVCGGDVVCFLRTYSWPGVNSLKVRMFIERATYDADHEYMKTLCEQQKQFCNAMVKHMPGIASFSAEMHSLFEPCFSFGRLVVETYLQQLRSLECSAEMLDGIAELPSQLTSLSIKFILQQPIRLPRLDVGMLERLEILDASYGFDLFSLVDLGESKIVKFPSLISLKLAYCKYQGYSSVGTEPEAALVSDNADSPKMLFPKLEKLVLDVARPRPARRLLFSGQYCWENVTSLALLSDPSFGSPEDDETNRLETRSVEHNDDDRAKDESSFQVKPFRCLLQSMPRISKLSFDARPYSLLDSTIKTQSAGYFADRLAHIDIGPRTTLSFPQFSKDLVSLHIAATNESWLQFPYLNTRALQRLHLNKVPYNRFWQIFRNSSIDNALFFDNLGLLNVGFDKEEVSSIEGLEGLSISSSGGGGNLVVRCPKLQEIYIDDAHVCGLWSVFSNEQNVWSNVSRLCVQANYDSMVQISGDSKASADETSRIMQFIDALNKRIICQLPNISDLVANPSTNPNKFDYPFSPLIRAYSRQLKRLVCKRGLSLDGCSFSDRLHTLDIELDGTLINGLPALDTNSLETLRLWYTPSSFMWSWFKTGPSLDEIRFNGLSEININTRDAVQHMPAVSTLSLNSSAVDEDNSRLKVYLPRLHLFSISLESRGVKCWDADIYTNNVAVICLTGPFSSIATISRSMFFKSVGSYYLNFESMEIEDENLFYDVTNQVFSDSKIYSHSNLHLPQMPFDIRAEDVNWVYLTNFSCYGIRFTTLTSLLPKLINLRSLNCELVFNSMPDLADKAILSTSVYTVYATLSSEHSGGNYEPLSDEEDKTAFSCAAYLIASMPNLRRAGIHGNVSWTLPDVVEKYKDEFPHLSRLQI